MQKRIQDLMLRYAQDIRSLFHDKLDKVIVYGSYARGDQHNNSDIDVMILVRVPEEELFRYRNMASDIAFNYLMSDGVDISPVVQNVDNFNYWLDTLPYYQNVDREGVVLSA